MAELRTPSVFGEVGVDVGAEVAEGDERAGAGVFHRVAGGRSVGGDEELVGCHLAEADQRGRGDVVHTHRAFALHRDPAAGAGVFHRDLCARLERELLRAEELLAVDVAVDDPAVGRAGALRFSSMIGSRKLLSL